MKNKFLALLAAGSLAFMMQACGDDNGSSVKFDDEEISSSSEEDSSSSVKSSSSSKKVSSSSAKDDSKSSSSTKGSSSSAKDDSKSSSSTKDSSSSAKEDGESSSSETPSSPSSSSSGESSSSEEVFELKSGYVLFNDPNYTSQVGELRWVENGKISDSKLEFYQDSKVVRAGDNLFVLERLGTDNVSMINTSTKSVAWQQKVDEGGNPSDIVSYKGQVLWVSQEAADAIYAVDMSGTPMGGIDVSAFKSENGVAANVVDLEITGDTLVVLMQRYAKDGWNYVYPQGLIALFDIKDKESVYQDASNALATIELTTSNPYVVKVVNGALYVGTHADYNSKYGTDADASRGIEKIDLSTGTSSMFVAGTELGGGVITMDVDYSKGIAYAVVRGAAYGAASVVEVNLTSGLVKTIDGLSDPEGGLAYDEKNGVLLIGDRSYDGIAVYAFDGKKLHKIEYAAEVTFAPYSIAF